MSNILFYFFGFLFLTLFLISLWMRLRMRISKGRFALTVLSSLLTCLLTGVSAITSSLPAAIISKFSDVFGFGSIETVGTLGKLLIAILTLGIGLMIYRFGKSAVRAWDAPPRVSEIELKERYQENDITALSLAQINLLLHNQNDPLASDAVANWNSKVSELPTPTPTRILLKDMLVSSLREIRIRDDGWRDEGNLWVGEIRGLRAEDTNSIIVFICEAHPSREDIQSRLEAMVKSSLSLQSFTYFALYMSGKRNVDEVEGLEVLGQDIKVLSSRKMILNSLDLLNYAREIIDEFENSRVGGTKTTLEDSFVELKVDTSSIGGSTECLTKKLSDWLTEDDTREHIALTGEYGQGKSTALLKLCYDWAKKFVDTKSINERVPLLIELRGHSPYETEPLGFLSPWCARFGLQPQQVFNLIKAGEALVIFEGFDELRNAGREFYRHQHFNALWRFAYPGVKIIFTGRPNFFLDQGEANRTLRTQESRKMGGDNYTSVWRLKLLDQNQILKACRSYDLDIREGIKSAIKEDQEFLGIASRPSMLPVVATIWSDIQNIQKSGGALTGALLIEKYIQATFSRKEAELERDRIKLDAPSGSRYLVLPKQIREFLTICVAWRMSGLKLKNTIPRSEIIDMIRELYENLIALSKSDGVSSTIAERMIEFERRFSDKSLAERIEVMAAEVCSAGLLIPDPAGGASNLRFPHKQFFEFLIAKGIAIKTNSTPLQASVLLNKSSPAQTIDKRVLSEPNSISYLVDCIGVDIGKIIPTSVRIFLLLILWLIESLKPLKIVKFQILETQDLLGDEVPPEELNKPLRKIIEFFSIGIVGTFAFGPAFYLSNFYPSKPDLELIIVVPLLAILSAKFAIAVLPSPSVAVDSFHVAKSFFLAHWRKQKAGLNVDTDEKHKSFMSSLKSGKVSIGEQTKCHLDQVAFLYPAIELGVRDK